MRRSARSGDKRWARGAAVFIATALWAAAAFAGSGPSNKIHEVRVTERDGTTVVAVIGSQRPSFTAFKLSSPKRLVIDIADSEVRGVPSILDAKTGVVDGVAVSQYSVKGVPVSRVVINFREDAAYRVNVKGNDLLTTLSGSPIADAETAKGESSDAVAAVRAEAEAAKRSRDEARAELEQMKSVSDGQRAEVEKLKAENDSRRAEAEAAERSRDEARAKLEQLKAENDGRRTDADAARKEADAARAKAEAALAELTALRKQQAALGEAKANASETAADLEQKLVKYRKQAEAADATAREEQKKRVVLEARLADLKRKVDAATENAETASAARRTAETEAERLRAEADSRAKEAAVAKQEAARTIAARREAELAYQRAAEGDRATLKEVLRTKEREARDAGNKVARLEAERQKTKSSLTRALKDLEGARREAEEAARKQAALESQTGKELALALAAKREAESATLAAEQRAAEARGEKDSLAKEMESLKLRAAAERSDAKTRVAEASAKVKEAEARAALADAKVKEADAARQSTAARVAEAEKRFADSEKRTQALEREIALLKAKAAAPPPVAQAPAPAPPATNDSELTQEERRLQRLAAMQGKTAPAAPAQKAPETVALPLVESVEFVSDGDVQKILVRTSSPLEYATTKDSVGNTTISFKNAALAPMLERTLDVTDFGGIVRSVASYREGDQVKVDIAVGRRAEIDVKRGENEIEWAFTATKKPAVAAVAAEEETGPSGTRTRTVAREEGDAYAYTAERTAGTTLRGGGTEARKKQYTGRHIDLDFKDADIHNILRLLADVGHVNIITSDDVKGAVTIRMRDVAWDHALDVILQAKRLGMVREGNLIRVAPEEVLEKEREMEIARRKQKMALEPLETRLIPVSYAKASELMPRASDLVTERGKLSVDNRTNVIIARDTKIALDQIEALIRNLDTQTPQVLIESRIVEASSTYAREIGIQWGGDFVASSASGNPTGLAFPSTVGLAGGATDNKTPMNGLSTEANGTPNPNFAVNLPAAVGTGSGGALGITLGSIANNANLSLRLSAMEETGTLRILSSPKILTLDNREAHIEQGTLIPYSQISAQGIQTAFKEAKLNLTVTPHVTADGSVLLNMKVMRDEPDFNNKGARGDPTILKREAETELLVSDGHTAVIGGIFTRNSGSSYKKVPFLADIPVLGWLFKNKTDTDRRSEMLIFITPRIVNRAESIGQ